MIIVLKGDFYAADVEAHGEREKFSFCEKISLDSLHKHSRTTIEHARACIDIAFDKLTI